MLLQAQKKEEPLSYLCEHRVPFPKAVWFIKMSAAHAMQVQETNKSKKRQVPDPSVEWTIALVKFMKDQLSELARLVQQHSSSSSSGLSGMVPGGKRLNWFSFQSCD